LDIIAYFPQTATQRKCLYPYTTIVIVCQRRKSTEKFVRRGQPSW
jgi:hypothetical protein